jgi:hypothetical protein
LSYLNKRVGAELKSIVSSTDKKRSDKATAGTHLAGKANPGFGIFANVFWHRVLFFSFLAKNEFDFPAAEFGISRAFFSDPSVQFANWRVIPLSSDYARDPIRIRSY